MLEIEGEIDVLDLEMLSNPAQLQVVPVYRAGSRIPLHLKSGVDDSSFDRVTFYVDGVRLGIDDKWPFSAIFFHSMKEITHYP